MSPTACDLLGAALAPALPVLVVTGVGREAKIAAGREVAMICSGGAPERLREMLAARPQPDCRAVISFGVAGGLEPTLRPGDIVLATKVVANDREWLADAALTALLGAALLKDAKLRTVMAPLAGVDVALICATSKRTAFEGCGASAVDIESHIAAEYAERHGLPFAALRVVCDPAGRGLPPLIASALKPDGSVSLAGVLGSVLRRPGQVFHLPRLAIDARLAFRALGRCGGALPA